MHHYRTARVPVSVRLCSSIKMAECPMGLQAFNTLTSFYQFMVLLKLGWQQIFRIFMIERGERTIIVQKEKNLFNSARNKRMKTDSLKIVQYIINYILKKKKKKKGYGPEKKSFQFDSCSCDRHALSNFFKMSTLLCCGLHIGWHFVTSPILRQPN